MMFNWYRAWMGRIEPVELKNITAKTVVLANGRRESRDAWRFYAPTWEEAHAHLLAEAEKSLGRARRSLELAQGHLGNVKGMKPPGLTGMTDSAPEGK